MRGKISEQDLTDYALNELQPEERLYVESMLAVSEECRNDVYETIDLGMMLEEGFEAQEQRVPAALTREQRRKVLYSPQTVPVWKKAAALTGLAASVAVAAIHPGLGTGNKGSGAMAKVSTQMSKMVAEAGLPANVNLANSLSNLQALAEDTSSWWSAATEVFSQSPMVCTPPSWLEAAPSAGLGE